MISGPAARRVLHEPRAERRRRPIRAARRGRSEIGARARSARAGARLDRKLPKSSRRSRRPRPTTRSFTSSIGLVVAVAVGLEVFGDEARAAICAEVVAVERHGEFGGLALMAQVGLPARARRVAP